MVKKLADTDVVIQNLTRKEAEPVGVVAENEANNEMTSPELNEESKTSTASTRPAANENMTYGSPLNVNEQVKFASFLPANALQTLLISLILIFLLYVYIHTYIDIFIITFHIF